MLEKQHYYWIINMCPFMHNFKKLNHFDIIYFQRKKYGDGVFKSPCSPIQHFVGLSAISAVLIQWQAVPIQTQIPSKLILLQYTQQCIRIVKGYFFYTDEAKQFFTGWHTKQGKVSNNTGQWHLFLMWLLSV